MAAADRAEEIERLRRRSDEAIRWARDTPGALINGRMIGCDDPDRLGWDVILATLARDGVFGFRMIPVTRTEALAARLAEAGYRIDFWDVFAGGAATLAQSEAVLAEPLPDGLAARRLDGEGETPLIAAAQALMLAAGVVPFSAGMLSGRLTECATVGIVDRDGKLAATGYTYRPHNRFSPYARDAWAGLIAVDPAWRGKRLGVHVNALAVRAGFRALGADRVHEFVSASNIASRRMLAACGLALDEHVKIGIATRGERFTR
jgi:hypothetical protein